MGDTIAGGCDVLWIDFQPRVLLHSNCGVLCPTLGVLERVQGDVPSFGLFCLAAGCGSFHDWIVEDRFPLTTVLTFVVVLEGKLGYKPAEFSVTLTKGGDSSSKVCNLHEKLVLLLRKVGVELVLPQACLVAGNIDKVGKLVNSPF